MNRIWIWKENSTGICQFYRAIQLKVFFNCYEIGVVVMWTKIRKEGKAEPGEYQTVLDAYEGTLLRPDQTIATSSNLVGQCCTV